MEYSYLQFFRDLASYIRPYQRMFWVAVFFRFISDVARLYPIWAISVIVPLLAKPWNTETQMTTTWILLFFAIASLVFVAGHNAGKYFGYQVAERAGLDLYKRTLAHVFILDMGWQEHEASGNKMKRIDRGRDGVNEMIRRVFDVVIEAIVDTVGIVLIFFTFDPFLSGSLLLFIIAFFIIGTVTLRKASRQERLVNREFEDLSGITFESLNNIHTIKSLSIQKSVLLKVEQQLHILTNSIRKRILYFRYQSISLNTFYYGFELVMIVLIVSGIASGQYTVSLLVLFIGMFQRVGESTRELTDLAQEIVRNKIWVSRAVELLDTPPHIEHPERIKSQVSYPRDWKKVTVSGVRFGYKKGQALRNVSFEIKRGESVGIVGLSGAGKSTLFKLLLDLYEDYEGEILLDKTPLKDIRRQSYIDHVSVVLQDTELFNMSLQENIEIANVSAKEAKFSLSDVIRMAHLEKVVKNLPEGLQSIVGEKGTKLSGGQRQRVGIARALYRQPDILLMDEATSHLDGESEKQIQLALSEVMHNFTTIVIAHRLSTIQQMDKIIVLERGQIKEIGSFTELVKKGGSFARMWKQQKL